MSKPAPQMLHALIAENRGALLADWRERLRDAEVGDAGELRAEMVELLDALLQLLGSAEGEASRLADSSLDRVLSEAARTRAVRGQSPESSVRFVQALKDVLLARVMAAHGQTDPQHLAGVTHLLTLMDRCVTSQVTQFVAARENVISGQAQSLLDMSTPVITLWESILLLPLVGVVDSLRAVQIAERLLEAIGRTEAEVTLIDVTGVPVMDTSVARHLMRTVAAAEMLGTRVILTGISPTTAQTIVKLGINMSAVPTRGTLKAGVALALQLTGRRIGGAAGADHGQEG